MASIASNDGSEDVNDFLRRIQKMKESEIAEDTERSKRLEQDILERRRQREAKAIGRERSMSPAKPSITYAPPLARKPDIFGTKESTRPQKQLSEQQVPMTMPHNSEGNGSDLPVESEEALFQSTAGKSMPLNRSNTLSWQRRPETLQGPKVRPSSILGQSQIAKPVNSAGEQAIVGSEQGLSRNDIAQNLASKDPNWFRQTADRGIGSPAYRKTSGEATGSNDAAMSRFALHGLSREATPTYGFNRTPVGEVDTPVPRVPLKKEDQQMKDVPDTTKGIQDLPDSSVQHDDIQPLVVGQQMSASASQKPQARNTPFERSIVGQSESPVKPNSGFAQSAMLKRSESITKRSKFSQTAELGRQDAISGTAKALEKSPLPSLSAPSLMIASKSSQLMSGETSGLLEDLKQTRDQIPTEGNPRHERSNSSVRSRDWSLDKIVDVQSPPSPSKRWSPVKSSWLESALSRPESPTPLTLPPSQPAWMTSLTKAKSQRQEDSGSGHPLSVAGKQSSDKIHAQSTPYSSYISSGRTVEPGKASGQVTDPNKTVDDTMVTQETDKKTLEVIDVEDQSSESIKQSHNDADTLNATQTQKVKPAAPPKKDMRSILKPRPTSIEQGDNAPLEFQNAFGKLKRTRTQNYVAPDELKNNILRGKAGLTITDGPQKTPRRDELKEDLLKQKEIMKSKASDPSSKPPPVRKSSGSVIPEAIAKKKLLGQSNTIEKLGPTVSSNGSPQSATKVSREQGPRTDINVNNRNRSDHVKTGTPTIDGNVTESRISSPPISNKLADRFNPTLVSILAKGPNQNPSVDTETRTGVSLKQVRPVNENDEDQATGQLQHITKGRARGPKRRLPTKNADGRSAPSQRQNVAQETSVRPKPVVAAKSRNITPIQYSASGNIESGTEISKRDDEKPNKTRTPNGIETAKESPSNPSPSQSRDPQVGTVSARFQPTQIGNSVKTTSSTENFRNTPTSVALGSPRKNFTRGKENNELASTPSKMGTSSLTKKSTEIFGGRSDNGTSIAVSKGEIQDTSSEPNISDRITTTTNMGRSTQLKPAQSHQSSALQTGPNLPIDPRLTNHLDKPMNLKSTEKASPPKPKPKPTLAKSANQGGDSTTRVLETRRLLAEFFDDSPAIPSELEISVQRFVSCGDTESTKTTTFKRVICVITSDGKTASVPSNVEHILYSDFMYVCAHVFVREGGERDTEAYFWIGGEVGESASNDAQIFAKRFAKDNNGTLVTLRQGRETPRFFQALGGIVIIRCAKTRIESKPFMLQGRQHLGHLAFDEVNYDATSLSSGYPSIFTAGPKKTFLWKGRGSSNEEIAGARLISIDVNPTANVIEMDEGKETADFHAIFPAYDRKSAVSGTPWDLKPKHEKYFSRLFHIEWHERPISSHNTGPANALWSMVRRQSQPSPTHLSVVEISPFLQEDLRPENVYVLDTFFELYIILGPLTQSKQTSFANALLFAREYSIACSSDGARSFEPNIFVALEGLPASAKSSFRFWDDEGLDTSWLMAGRPKMSRGRQEQLKLIDFSDAFAACQRANSKDLAIIESQHLIHDSFHSSSQHADDGNE